VSIMGTRVMRTEDPRLLTVGGAYVDDIRVPELTRAARVTFVRSPIGHARITGIDAAAALPSFALLASETPATINPLGFKGIGEAGTIGATPAVQNAVIDALSHLGVRHIDMPMTPARVWAAISEAQAPYLG
jgi:CO/xanthine dehydrogenase Mo-binding subunit